MQGSDQVGLLRASDAGEQQVTPLELFFDLVYVFAITQLSHLLLDHLTVWGVLQTVFLLLVVWWAWQYTTWFTNWFDPDLLPVRLTLVALAYVAIQVGRTAFAILTLGASHPLSSGFRRILAWFVASGVVWVTGS